MEVRGAIYRCRRCHKEFSESQPYWDEAEHAEAVVSALYGCPADLEIIESEPGFETRLGGLSPDGLLYGRHEYMNREIADAINDIVQGG